MTGRSGATHTAEPGAANTVAHTAGRAARGSAALAAGAAEVTPLSQRAATMMVFRTVEATVLTILAVWTGASSAGSAVVGGAAYLLAAGVLSLGVLVPNANLAVRSFGLSLLLDGVYLELQHAGLGSGLAIEVALAADLVAVCLLASFRTGLKIAIWQSLLLLIASRAQETKLFPAPVAPGALDADHVLASDMALLWLVVVTTAVATAVNERELRRRRYDAEALARLATDLHADEHPRHVAARVLRFAVDELDASRALMCRWGSDGPTLLGVTPQRATSAAASRGTPAAGSPHAAPSALLTLAARRDGPTLALRLDPARDPWLAGLLPEASNLVVLPLSPSWSAGADERRDPVWLVLEHRSARSTGATRPVGSLRPGRGRAERRMLSTAGQAAATASLALSRADLLQRAERAASTDALTGVANRRTFDATLERLMGDWARDRRPFGLVLVDVDHFKSINDRFGHQVGDEALQAVAAALAATARPGDVAARYGGEEFALLLPDTAGPQAAEVAERARLALHGIEQPVRLSASFGVAAVPRDADTASSVVNAADTALIRAKNTGRDRVVDAGAGDAVPALPLAPR